RPGGLPPRRSSGGSGAVTTRRIGVASAIPDPYGSALQAFRESYGDPLPTAIPAHVTLLPPPYVHDNALTSIAGHLRKAALAGPVGAARGSTTSPGRSTATARSSERSSRRRSPTSVSCPSSRSSPSASRSSATSPPSIREHRTTSRGPSRTPFPA